MRHFMTTTVAVAALFAAIEPALAKENSKQHKSDFSVEGVRVTTKTKAKNVDSFSVTVGTQTTIGNVSYGGDADDIDAVTGTTSDSSSISNKPRATGARLLPGTG